MQGALGYPDQMRKEFNESVPQLKPFMSLFNDDDIFVDCRLTPAFVADSHALLYTDTTVLSTMRCAAPCAAVAQPAAPSPYCPPTATLLLRETPAVHACPAFDASAWLTACAQPWQELSAAALRTRPAA